MLPFQLYLEDVKNVYVYLLTYFCFNFNMESIKSIMPMGYFICTTIGKFFLRFKDYWIILDIYQWENRADPDQRALIRALWSGSILLAYICLCLLSIGKNRLIAALRLMSQCKWIFGDISVTSSSSSNSPRSFEGFRRTLRGKFHSNRTTGKKNPHSPPLKNSIFTMGVYGEILHLVESGWNFASEFVKNLQMIEVSLSLIERDLKKISPKNICTRTWLDSYNSTNRHHNIVNHASYPVH